MKRVAFWLLEQLGVNALCRWWYRGHLKVLLYHSISEPGQPFSNAVSPHDFSLHVGHLKRYYNLVHMDAQGRIHGCISDRVNVLITFDDGFVDNHNVASLILGQNGVSAVFFLIASCVSDGSAPQFLMNRATSLAEKACPAWRTVNVEQVQAMRGAGMTIGSHGTLHIDYARTDVKVGIDDATEAKNQLEHLLGATVSAFAFPWGRHKQEHLKALQEIYTSIFLTKPGFSRPTDRVFYRNEVADLAHMKCATSGALDLIKRCQR